MVCIYIYYMFVFFLFLGHLNLRRLTAAEREEAKKRDRRGIRGDEEDVLRMTWCKYTLGLKHQVCIYHLYLHVYKSILQYLIVWNRMWLIY